MNKTPVILGITGIVIVIVIVIVYIFSSSDDTEVVPNDTEVVPNDTEVVPNDTDCVPDSDLACATVITCIDGLLYPDSCGPKNCQEPIGKCDDDTEVVPNDTEDVPVVPNDTEDVPVIYNTPETFSDIFQRIISQPSFADPSSDDNFDSNKYLIIKSSDNEVYKLDNFNLTTISLDADITYKDLFEMTFFAVPEIVDEVTYYRLDSQMHSLYALDYDGNDFTLTDTRSINYMPDNDNAEEVGYVLFEINNNQIIVKQRRLLTETVYNTDKDTELTGSWDILSSSYYFSMPTDFNPDGIDKVVNDPFPWQDLTIVDYTENYINVGTGVSIDEIDSDILRYDKELYLAFKEGLEARSLQCKSVLNGEIGDPNVQEVYFTNHADDEGVHHPFMVIASLSISERTNDLFNVAKPPGDGIDEEGGYTFQSVTRDCYYAKYLCKIPMRDYGQIDSLEDNTLPASLWSDVQDTVQTKDVYNYASLSANGIAIDGVVIYPLYNNVLDPAPEHAEITDNGIHVGRGLNLHYHSDGYSANNVGLNLYNDWDYVGDHPPLIGFGFDGIALYGKYNEETELDEYGGHSHGEYGYHYHSHTEERQVNNGTDYTAHILLKGAWAGNINDIPEFWDDGDKPKPAYGDNQSHAYVGK